MSILEYNNDTLIKKVEDIAKQFPKNIAYEFLGSKCNYQKFVKDVEEVAKSLSALGVKENEIVCVSMPNTPQAITFIYALNKIGAVANMLDPRTNPENLKESINDAKSNLLLSMDAFCPMFEQIVD